MIPSVRKTVEKLEHSYTHCWWECKTVTAILEKKFGGFLKS